MENNMVVTFDSISENEGLARLIAAGFAAKLNPTLEEMADIKTAVSEAVTNAIVHGYYNMNGQVIMKLASIDNELYIEVIDEGVGIEDIEKAKEPLYTTKPDEERTGMGFVFMEIFMDELRVESSIGKGTHVYMKKIINKDL